MRAGFHSPVFYAYVEILTSENRGRCMHRSCIKALPVLQQCDCS